MSSFIDYAQEKIPGTFPKKPPIVAGPGEAVVTMLSTAAGPGQSLQSGQRYALPMEQAQTLVAAGAAESPGLEIPESVYAAFRPVSATEVKKRLTAARRKLAEAEQKVEDLTGAIARTSGRLETLKATQAALIDAESLEDLEAIEEAAVTSTAQIATVERILDGLTRKRATAAEGLQRLRNEVASLETLLQVRKYLAHELEVVDQLQALRPILQELMDLWSSAFWSADPSTQAVVTARVLEPLLDAIDKHEERRAALADVLV